MTTKIESPNRKSPSLMNKDEDPDTYLAEASVAEVRAFERRTRQNIESRKKELRTMVGEQYLDLIAAADTITDMDRKAKVIQANFQRMQGACDATSIQKKASQLNTLQPNEQKSQDQKRRQLYILAALIKSLADVPEQIWHALEGHQYLQAGSLYILAQQVHEYLETEESFMIDTDLAFPVVQRQWDAISFFRPQIIQKSINHLRVVVLETDEVAKVIVGLMQLDDMTMKSTLETLLEMRTKAIDELLNQLVKEKSNNQEQKLSRHLREMAYIIKRTIIHVHNIYLPLTTTHLLPHSSLSPTIQSLLEYYVEQMQKKFTIPTSSSFNNTNHTKNSDDNDINNNSDANINKTVTIINESSTSSSTLPAVARLFAPSTNVHLLIRYLPECIQTFAPKFKLENRSNELNKNIINDMITKWLEERKNHLETQLSTILQSIPTNQKLVEIRSKLWDLLLDDEYENGKIKWEKICNDLLGNHYSIYEKIFRSPLNNRAKQIIDMECSSISKQPIDIIWPSVVNIKDNKIKKNFQLAPIIWPSVGIHSNFNLPNFSSSMEITNFKKALHEASTERTSLLTECQDNFDKAWNQLRNDVNHHVLNAKHDHFHSQTDANNIKQYFRNQCEKTTLNYINELQKLIETLKQWPQHNNTNDVSIWLGRLSRLISEDSKELPKSLSFTTEENDIFELKSGVGKDVVYAQLQEKLYFIYQESHNGWIEQVCNNFVQQLSIVLNSTKWDDQCPYILAWENLSNKDSNDIVLPTIASNGIENVIFGICKEIQRIQCTRLDMVILQNLCQKLYDRLIETFNSFISAKENKDDNILSPVTEKGALQLLFDLSFIVRVLQNHKHSISILSFLQPLKNKVDPINWAVFETYYDDNVEKYYLKQTLLLGVLLRTNNETFERARKAMIGNQHGQQQYNVLPLAPQAQRFTLLPIGHGASIRSR